MILVVATFCLVVLGGAVTSKGVGLSVPDWPTTFNYNMFVFPPSMWVGGVYWEHTHRLLGSAVGLLAIVMAVWLWYQPGPRRGLRWFGLATLVMVIVQGIMGGLRVTQMSVFLAVLHGITAQIFLCMTVLIAAVTGGLGGSGGLGVKATGQDRPRATASRGLRIFSLALLIVMGVQLSLGATMRHTGAGLAIPDFPSSYGQIIPPLTTQGIIAASDQLQYDDAPVYFTRWQVLLHFAHRAWALVVLICAGCVVGVIGRQAKDNQSQLIGPMMTMIGLLLVQLALGAGVIWTGRHPEVATAHQATGAALLAVVTVLVIRVHQLSTGPPRNPQSPTIDAALSGLPKAMPAT